MSLDTQIADLVTATTALTLASSLKKAALDAAVLAASTSLPGTPMVLFHAYSNKQFGCDRANGSNVVLESVVIPGNTLGPTSLIDICAMYSFTGNNNKDPLIRIGPTTGNFSTAQNILNNQGLSSTKTFIASIRGHNKNSLSSNIWTPPQSIGLGNMGGNTPMSYAVDFSQSVTIYFGGTCLNGYGDSTEIVRLETYSVTVTK